MDREERRLEYLSYLEMKRQYIEEYTKMKNNELIKEIEDVITDSIFIYANENYIKIIKGVVRYYRRNNKLSDKQKNVIINALAEYYATDDTIYGIGL